MPAQRVHAVVRTLAGVLMTLAILAPSASAQSAMNADDDTIKAIPTGVRDVLANDSGSSADLRVVSNTQPANGTATCSALGACLYKANGGFTGNDSFAYTARDTATGTQDTATVNVTVSAGTAAGEVVARDDDVATLVNRAVQVRPLDNDEADGTTFEVDAQPKHGTVSCDAAAVCTYTPAAGYVGSDGFPYTISRSGQQASRQSLGNVGGPVGGPGSSSAAVHILVAPGDTGYRIGVGGSPASVPPGGKANWALGVFTVPDGISGEELRALVLPSGSGTLSGPHALDSGSLKPATGWTAERGADGKLHYRAGDNALLGEARTQTFPKPLPPIRQGTGGRRPRADPDRLEGLRLTTTRIRRRRPASTGRPGPCARVTRSGSTSVTATGSARPTSTVRASSPARSSGRTSRTPSTTKARRPSGSSAGTPPPTARAA